jgi:phospholipid/cholesterol/gamma-HCH transport system substrate-binding protein
MAIKDGTRNFAVGLTVLIGLAVLSGIIVLFTGLPELFTSGYLVHVKLNSSHGVAKGDVIHHRGIEVGRVTKVELTKNRVDQGVTITVEVKSRYDLPGNSRLKIQPSNFFGPPYLDIQSGDEYLRDKQGRIIRTLPKNDTAVIPGDVSHPDLIPPEMKKQIEMISNIGPALDKFGQLADNLNKLIGPLVGDGKQGDGQGPDAQPDNGQDGPTGMAKTLGNLEVTLEGLATFFGDEENRKNFQTSLANLAEATESAKAVMQDVREVTEKLKSVADSAGNASQAIAGTADRASARIDELAESVLTQTEKVSQLLQTIHVAARKLSDGDGTAGQMLNNPELYNSLVDAVEQVDSMAKEMRALVAEWKESGMGVKLK